MYQDPQTDVTDVTDSLASITSTAPTDPQVDSVDASTSSTSTELAPQPTQPKGILRPAKTTSEGTASSTLPLKKSVRFPEGELPKHTSATFQEKKAQADEASKARAEERKKAIEAEKEAEREMVRQARQRDFAALRRPLPQKTQLLTKPASSGISHTSRDDLALSSPSSMPELLHVHMPYVPASASPSFALPHPSQRSLFNAPVRQGSSLRSPTFASISAGTRRNIPVMAQGVCQGSDDDSSAEISEESDEYSSHFSSDGSDEASWSDSSEESSDDASQDKETGTHITEASSVPASRSKFGQAFSPCRMPSRPPSGDSACFVTIGGKKYELLNPPSSEGPSGTRSGPRKAPMRVRASPSGPLSMLFPQRTEQAPSESEQTSHIAPSPAPSTTPK